MLTENINRGYIDFEECEVINKLRFIVLLLLVIIVGFSSNTYAGENKEDTALLLIDIQNFYFPGGRSELVDPEPASLNAQQLQGHRSAGISKGTQSEKSSDLRDDDPHVCGSGSPGGP